MKSFANPIDADEIIQRLKRLRPDSPRRWGRMTVHQMVCHLNDSFRMALGEKPVDEPSGRIGPKVIKFLALYVPMQWRPGHTTVPEIDQEQQGTRPSEFGADVADVAAFVGRVAARDGAQHWPPHPIFGTMSEADWLRWAYLHTDHHLRQFGA